MAVPLLLLVAYAGVQLWIRFTDSTTINGAGIGAFSSSIKGLIPNTIYYVRAYATNATGTSYGSSYTITTPGSDIGGKVGDILTVSIPEGNDTLGSRLTEVGRVTDELLHVVSLSAFNISKYEITNAQYADFLNAKGIGSNGIYAASVSNPTEVLIYPNSLSGLIYSGSQWVAVAGYETSPVIDVTWFGANEFANSIRGRLLNDSVKGRLPTEAEWEYACRAGTSTPFSTGNSLTNAQANYDWAYPYNGGVNTILTSPRKKQPVGTYPPNAWGLYDVHGNVAEWCNDWSGGYSLYIPIQVIPTPNPPGVTTGTNRVLRGGSWNGYVQYCRSAARDNALPTYHNYAIGFRVAFGTVVVK